jgi:hypothetical protein
MVEYRVLNYGFIAVYTRSSKLNKWKFSGIFASTQCAKLAGF